MDAEDAPRTHNKVPRPAPPPPAAPPMPQHSPGERFLTWLRTPRPSAPVGVWRLGYTPRPDREPDQVPGRQLVLGAVVSLFVAWIIWSLMWNGYLGTWWMIPLELFTPDSWRFGGDQTTTLIVYYGYYALIAAGLLWGAARAGRWGEVWRRYAAPKLRRTDSATVVPQRAPGEDPADWPQMRAAGAGAAADRLAADARAGAMRDIDHVRIDRAWEGVRRGAFGLQDFVEAVSRDGAAACGHPSGVRDLQRRAAVHDLLTHQVRVGSVADTDRNPYKYRGVGAALGPQTLGTSLLAVGPSGAGKTRRVLGPVAEALRLQALAGRAAVVVVGAAGASLGADDEYDVVIRIGQRDSEHDLSLYGGATDPDEAATVLAEALVGDLADPQASDGRRAATVLGQLLGPFHAVHDRFPTVQELRDLLEGTPKAYGRLRSALDAAGHDGLLRELDARERQSGSAGDPGVLLADRVALLDRPAFSGFFTTTERAFSLAAIDHPLRVRVDLPERSHGEASRILARLILAQFTATAVHRRDRSLFACLVLDDAARTVTPEGVRSMQRLRSSNAGVVLALRTLDDVPVPLRTSLLGAVGCRVVMSGVSPWDGQQFAEVWGKEWIEARDVTDREIVADEPMRKISHVVRKAITGKAPMQQAVTVRQVERERWSSSDLSNAVPAGHAVLSLTSVDGDVTPPLLVDLRS